MSENLYSPEDIHGTEDDLHTIHDYRDRVLCLGGALAQMKVESVI